MTTKKVFSIVPDSCNPSEPDLIDSLARAYDAPPRPVTFMVDDGERTVRITGLQHESEGLYSFSGNIMVGSVIQGRVEGSYNVVKRCGTLKLMLD